MEVAVDIEDVVVKGKFVVTLNIEIVVDLIVAEVVVYLVVGYDFVVLGDVTEVTPK